MIIIQDEYYLTKLRVIKLGFNSINVHLEPNVAENYFLNLNQLIRLYGF